jgi:membrane protein YqaA with SNARE-associated domain
LRAFLFKIAATLEAFLLPFGAWGLMAIAFFDSAFLPLPTAIDVWVITLSIRNPSAIWLYGLVATVGSVLGCLVLYHLARAGGHAAAERKIGAERLLRIRNWFERHEFLTVVVPSLMPPPTPFKAFIITAGVSQVHLGKFVIALTIGRGIRYFGMAILAVKYGPSVWQYAVANGPYVFGTAVLLVLTAVLTGRVVKRQRERRALAAGPGEAVATPSVTAQTVLEK